jgi:hypothetical protein
MGGFQNKILSSPESRIVPRPVLPTHGILKGGAYGSQEKGKEEGKKEKEVNLER